MADYPKGLNRSEGSNTFKFRKFRTRIDIAEHDIARRVRADHELLAEPAEGDTSSFFKEELDRLRELDITKYFSQLWHKLHPISRTMAQLVHHRHDIVTVLCAGLTDNAGTSIKSVLSLLAVLSRDLRGELYPFLDRIVAGLKLHINAAQPELTAEVFRTVSFFFKFLGSAMIESGEYTKNFDEWSAFLAHNNAYLRTTSAACLAVLARKLTDDELGEQVRVLVKTGGKKSMTEAGKEGNAQCIFEMMRGVKDCLHSRAPVIISSLFQSLAPAVKGLARAGGFDAYQTEMSNRFDVVTCAWAYAWRHCKNSSSEVLWLALQDCIKEAIDQCAADGELLGPAQLLTCKTLRLSQLLVLALQCMASRGGRAASMPASGLRDNLRHLFADRLWLAAHNGLVLRTISVQLFFASLEIILTPPAASRDSTMDVDDEQDRGGRNDVSLTTKAGYTFVDAIIRQIFKADAGTPSTALDAAAGQATAIHANKYSPFPMFVHELMVDLVLRLCWHAFELASAPGCPPHIGSALLRAIVPRLNAYVTPMLRVKEQLSPVWHLLIRIRNALVVHRDAGSALLSTTGRIVFDPEGNGLPAAVRASLASAAQTLLAVTDPEDESLAHIYEVVAASAIVDNPQVESVRHYAGIIRACDSRTSAASWNHTISRIRGTALSVLSELASKASALSQDDPLLRTALDDAMFAPSFLRATLSWMYHFANKLTSPTLHSEAADDQHALMALSATALYVEALSSQADAPARAILTTGLGATQCALLSPLLSHRDHSIRLCTLRILSVFPAPLFLDMHATVPSEVANESIGMIDCASISVLADTGLKAASDSVYAGCSDVVSTLLRHESLPNTTAHERSKLTLLTKLGPMLASKRVPPPHVLVCLHALAGVLHVKFATLWPAAVKLLAAATDAYPRTVWAILGRQLYLMTACRRSAATGVETTSDDPTACSPLGTALALLGGHGFGEGGSTDAETVHKSILDVLVLAPAFAEARSRVLVPIFLAFLRDQYFGGARTSDAEALELDLSAAIAMLGDRHQKTMSRKRGPAATPGFAVLADADALLQGVVDGVGAALPDGGMTRSALTSRLLNFLAVLEKFKSWDGIFGRDVLFQVLCALLTKVDGGVALAALKVLSMMDLPFLHPYKSNLLNLLSDTHFRDEMASFPLIADGGTILLEHRPSLLPLICRILYGRLVQRRGHGRQDALASRRAAILSYCASVTQSELKLFVHLVLRPFSPRYAKGGVAGMDSLPQPKSAEDVADMVAEIAKSFTVATGAAGSQLVTPTRALGFINVIHDIVKHCGHKLEPYIHHLLATLFALLRHAQAHHPDDSGDDATSRDLVPRSRDIRSAAILRLGDLLAAYPRYHFAPWIPVYQQSLTAGVMQLPLTAAHSSKPSAALQLLEIMSRHEELHHLLDAIPASIPAVFACLTGGLPASMETFALHVASFSSGPQAALGALPRGKHRGPAPAVVTAAFATIEQLFGIDQDALPGPVQQIRSRMIAHIPYLLRHCIIRMADANGCEVDDVLKWGARESVDVRLPSFKNGVKAFERRQLLLLAVISNYLGSLNSDAATRETVAPQLFLLLLPHLRSIRRSQKATDAGEAVFSIMANLIGHVHSPWPFVRYLMSLLMPGRLAFVGGSRQGLFAVLEKAAGHPALVDMNDGLLLLCDMGAVRKDRIGELDCDRIIDAINKLIASRLQALAHPRHVAGSLCELAPGFVHQLFYLMHDSDMAVRASSSNALSRLIQCFSAVAVGHWQHALGTQEILPGTLEPVASLVAASSSFDVVMYQMLKCVMPDIRSSLDTVGPAIRRGFIILLSDVVAGFRDVGLSQPASDNVSSVRYLTIPGLYLDLAALLNPSDPESDGFLNLTHVQVHRRARAILRIGILVSDGAFTPTTVTHILLPLTLHILFDEAAGGDDEYVESKGKLGKLGGKAKAQPYAGGLLTEAVRFIGIVSRQLTWRAYLQTIKLLVRQAASNPSSARVLFRGISAMAENFHCFIQSDGGDEVESARNGVLADANAIVLPALKGALFETAVTGKKRQDTGDESQRVVRTSVATALTHVLSAMPQSMLDTELPRVIAAICGGLRSRQQDARDAARTTLAKMCQIIGPRYVDVIASKLKESLKEGHLVHVIGYAVYSILDALLPQMQPAAAPSEDAAAEHPAVLAGSQALADSIPTLMSVIMDDATGEAAEQRDEASGYNPKLALKELKVCKSYDSIEIIGRCMPFLPNTCIHAVTAPLVATLERGANDAAVTVLFKRLLVGLTHNPSVSAKYVMLYVHGVCTRFLGVPVDIASALAPTGEPVKKKKLPPVSVWLVRDQRAALSARSAATTEASFPDDVPLTAAMRQLGSNVRSGNPEWTTVLPVPMSASAVAASKGHIVGTASGSSAADVEMGYFALCLLHASLRGGRITSKQEEDMRMLNPFIPMFVWLLGNAKDTRILATVLRTLSVLLPYGVPAIRAYGQRISVLVLSLVEKNTSASSESAGQDARTDLGQATIRAATALIRTCDYIKISEDQLRALLLLIRADLSVHTRQNSTYALLRAILSRRLMVAEVYDVMEDVGKHLVQTLHANARTLCASVFLQFLLKYPMTNNRLQAHLDFFIKNLAYPLEDGRLSVLDMLLAVISKFPQVVLDEYSAYMFLPLTVQLVNDASATCRAGIGAIIKQLFRRVTLRAAQELVDIALKWLQMEQRPGLHRAGYQAIGLAAEANPPCMLPRLNEVLALATRELTKAVGDLVRVEQRLQDGARVAEQDGEGAKPLDNRINTLETADVDMTAGIDGHVQVKLSWESSYYCLVALEKLYVHLPEDVEGCMKDTKHKRMRSDLQPSPTQAQDATQCEHEEPAWRPLVPSELRSSSLDPVSVASDLLLYPHAWVRLASSRLMGYVLARRSIPASDNDLVICPWLQDAGVMRLLCHRQATQFTSSVLSSKLAEQAAKNLVWLTLSLHALLGPIDRVLADADAEQSDAKDPLMGLFSRVCGFALQQHGEGLLAILKWIGAVCLKLPPDSLAKYAPTCIHLLNQVVTVDDKRLDNAKELAQELMDLLQGRLDPALWVQLLTAESTRMSTVRLARRKQRALQKVLDPASAARTKEARAQAKLRNKHKKTEQYRIMKGKPLAGSKRARVKE